MKGVCSDLNIVKGEFDEANFPETKVLQIGAFKIGLCHGHQVRSRFAASSGVFPRAGAVSVWCPTSRIGLQPLVQPLVAAGGAMGGSRVTSDAAAPNGRGYSGHGPHAPGPAPLPPSATVQRRCCGSLLTVCAMRARHSSRPTNMRTACLSTQGRPQAPSAGAPSPADASPSRQLDTGELTGVDARLLPQHHPRRATELRVDGH